jgi:hypothetical protein
MTDALCGTASTGLYSTVLYMMASSVASSSLLLTVAHDVRGFEEMHHVLLFPQHKRGFWPVAVSLARGMQGTPGASGGGGWRLEP